MHTPLLNATTAAARTIAPRWADTIAYSKEVVLWDSRHTNSLALASFTVLILDLLSNITDEIDLVWRKPWTFPSLLHVWNRYMTLFTVFLCLPFMFREVESNTSAPLTDVRMPATSSYLLLHRDSLTRMRRCRSFLITEAIASTLLFGSFDLMLMLRVWILYGRTRGMGYIFGSMLLVEVVSMSAIILRLESSIRQFIHLGPLLQGCYFSSSIMATSRFAFYAIPPLLVTILMFHLTTRKCLASLRLHNIPIRRGLALTSWVDRPVITLFLRDGIVWFVVVFAFYGAELVVWSVGRSTQMQVLIIPSLTLFSLISARVLLNTRALSMANKPPADDSDPGSSSGLEDVPMEETDTGAKEDVDTGMGVGEVEARTAAEEEEEEEEEEEWLLPVPVGWRRVA
ncbi:hypothetical protein MKEN_00233300 [Mycena kentingensis (nom. inval.)]|nr:hypothetical protein MKEN_00233300 [Mycena kentingensis (nom. inval.)]